MKNLDQIRGAAALAAVRRPHSIITGQTVNKLPPLILTNGLLAAAAFADECNREGEAKRPEMQDAMNEVAIHLSNAVHGITPLAGCRTAKALISSLCAPGASSSDLWRATTEALEVLSFLKRFTVTLPE